MLMQQTLTQLKALKLDGMARAFEEQCALTASTSLSFEERVGMLVDRELAWRDTRRLERLLRAAKLKNPNACVEDIEYRHSRGLDQRIVATLSSGDWVRNAQNLILTGPTGAGKTWLACAFGQQACRQGFSAFYVRVARLFEELKIAHGDGSFTRRLAQLAKIDVLILDDWGLQDLDQGARNDLLEVLDEFQLPACALINTAIYDHCPEVAAALRARGDEFIGHGRTNAERQAEMSEEAERMMIAEVTAGCSSTNPRASCSRDSPASSATETSASTTSSLRWFSGSERS